MTYSAQLRKERRQKFALDIAKGAWIGVQVFILMALTLTSLWIFIVLLFSI